MKEIYTNLFIGNDNDCGVCATKSDYSIVHACKTCHQRALNYRGSLTPTHPNYLVYEHGRHIYLNIVDMPNELLPKFAHPIFKKAMIFINREIPNNKVLIHCNMGQSRSPSLGLAYLAIIDAIPKKSYAEAINEFNKLYPGYLPGTGIMLYMQHNWDFLMNELSEPIK